MAKVIGFDETKFKRFVCCECTAIVEYTLREVFPKLMENGQYYTDEGTIIRGLSCPNCSDFHRTNP